MDETLRTVLTLVNTAMLLGVAGLTAHTNYVAKLTEKNTNSMKDALVDATKIASRAEGLAAGRAEGVLKAEGLEESKERTK